jgi:hypothetical protein
MADGPKRVHDPPTGQTPGKNPEKRRSGASGRFLRKSLFQSDTDLEQGVEQKNQKVSIYSNIMIASFSIVLIGNLNPVFSSLRMQQGIFPFVY